MIPFNKPYLSGKELHYISEDVLSGKIPGNGKYTQLSQQFFSTQFIQYPFIYFLRHSGKPLLMP